MAIVTMCRRQSDLSKTGWIVFRIQNVEIAISLIWNQLYHKLHNKILLILLLSTKIAKNQVRNKFLYSENSLLSYFVANRCWFYSCKMLSYWLISFNLTQLNHHMKDRITIAHLPDGPTACFKLSSYKPSSMIKVIQVYLYTRFRKTCKIIIYFEREY